MVRTQRKTDSSQISTALHDGRHFKHGSSGHEW